MAKPKIEGVANEVGSNLTAGGFKFDPLTLLAIIAAVVQLLSGCLQPAQAVKRVQKPSRLDKRILNRVINQHAKDTDDKDAIEAALEDYAETLTTPKMKAMFAEVEES